MANFLLYVAVLMDRQCFRLNISAGVHVQEQGKGSEGPLVASLSTSAGVWQP